MICFLQVCFKLKMLKNDVYNYYYCIPPIELAMTASLASTSAQSFNELSLSADSTDTNKLHTKYFCHLRLLLRLLKIAN
jgi:hypothetical protein